MMKKTYISPETDVIKINVVSVLAGSIQDGDNEGTVGFSDEGTPVGDFTPAARDDNNNNRGSVWDNAW